ncbi:MAG: MarR family transcriptional regulator [Clostridia bacterium]|nr:MarR family transcriptional regulator [Clostridia bacterium]MBO7689454.1 MarR family transcriptional regulator [Clostridia bacterium]MBP5460275.1 MarR family transcriptional regulator [Clostridia bacterium]
MTREDLIKAVWEEQHLQHGLMRRKRQSKEGAEPQHGPRGPHGHRPPARQEHLLHVLKRNPSINQKDLAEKFRVRPQTLGEMLAKMEENGLVVRTKDPADGRATLVDLTPAGEAAEQEHHEKILQDIKEKFAALTDDELKEYLRLMKKINESLSN